MSRIGGADEATYTVTLPGGYGGADAGDFGTVALTGTVRFESGQASARISLPVLGDTAPEPAGARLPGARACAEDAGDRERARIQA